MIFNFIMSNQNWQGFHSQIRFTDSL